MLLLRVSQTFLDCDVIVLNDEYRDNYYYGKPLLIKCLEEVLPGKSEFEKFDS